MTYEIPGVYSVRKALNSEKAVTKGLLNKIEKKHREWLEDHSYFMGGEGYDSGRLAGKFLSIIFPKKRLITR